MRLLTVEPRDEARGIAVIHTALDAGATLLDTADAYCLDDSDTGHNERLIARALKTWSGDARKITVATKGGLVRPVGRWVVDGRAKHLQSACLASLKALEVSAIDLYQLHAIDPSVPLETSVRALATLQQDGRIRRIGLSNRTVSQPHYRLCGAPSGFRALPPVKHKSCGCANQRGEPNDRSSWKTSDA